MLGALRLTLALLVVVNHLYPAADNRLGYHAVAAFYMLSGFLMTKVLNETYGFDRDGVGRFLANRLLRLMPAYWLFLAATLAMLWLFPLSFPPTSLIAWPQSAASWLANLTLVDLAWAPQILVPQGWTLGVELVFYAAMALGLSRTRLIVTVWFALSVAVTVVLLLREVGFGYRYYPYYAASLFFSAGAMLHAYRDALSRVSLAPAAAMALFATFASMPLWIELLGVSHVHGGFYLAALLFALILNTAQRWRPGTLAAADKLAGDLAYPVYLAHFLAAGLVIVLTDGAIARGSFAYLLLGTAVTIGLSLVQLRILDRPLQRLRDRLRPLSPPAYAMQGTVRGA